MDPLTLFGLVAVTAMVVFYALEHRSPWFIVAFAGGCALASVYGFLQGAWPFGLVEAVWTLVAVRRWWQVKAVREEMKSAEVEEATKAADGAKEQRILDLIREKGQVKRGDLLPVTGLSRSTLGRMLDEMEKKGLVEQVGERKGAYYKIKI